MRVRSIVFMLCGCVGCDAPSNTPAPPVDTVPDLNSGVEQGDTGFGMTPPLPQSSMLEVWLEGPETSDLGCPIEAQVSLTNHGDRPIEVEEVIANGAGWAVDPLSDVLHPGEQRHLRLTRNGALDAATVPELQVFSSAATTTGNWRSWGGWPGTAASTTATATVPVLDAIDLVVVTSAEGVGPYNPGHPFYEGLPALTRALSEAEVDWQLTLVTAATGCPSPMAPVIHAETTEWSDPDTLLAIIHNAHKCDVLGREFHTASSTLAQLDEGACAARTHRPHTPMTVINLRWNGIDDADGNWESVAEGMQSQLTNAPLRIDELLDSPVETVPWVDATDGYLTTTNEWVTQLDAYVLGLPVVRHVEVPVDAVDPSALQVLVDGVVNTDWIWSNDAVTWPLADLPPSGATVTVSFVHPSECPE